MADSSSPAKSASNSIPRSSQACTASPAWSPWKSPRTDVPVVMWYAVRVQRGAVPAHSFFGIFVLVGPAQQGNPATTVDLDEMVDQCAWRW